MYLTKLGVLNTILHMNRIIEKECGDFVGIRKFEQIKKVTIMRKLA